MPQFLRSGRAESKTRELEMVNAQLCKDRDALAALEIEMESCWRDNGDITRTGLELELRGLDERRRAPDVDPTDTTAQLLLQGQQNELVKLLGLRDDKRRRQEELRRSITAHEKVALGLSTQATNGRK